MFSLAFRTRREGIEYEYEYHFIEYEYEKDKTRNLKAISQGYAPAPPPAGNTGPPFLQTSCSLYRCFPSDSLLNLPR